MLKFEHEDIITIKGKFKFLLINTLDQNYKIKVPLTVLV